MSASLDILLQDLHDNRELKTWSLIITLFGDSIEPRGGSVSAHSVQTVMSRLGFGNGAVRTAVSRLANDGWVSRSKTGRNSFYSLTETGHEPFYRASQQIYASPESLLQQLQQDRWKLLIESPDEKGSRQLYGAPNVHSLTPHLHLIAEEDDRFTDNQNLLSLSGQLHSLPQWVLDKIGISETRQRYNKLEQRVVDMTRTPPIQPLDALAARTLLIHEWRRILLREKLPVINYQPLHSSRLNCHLALSKLYREISVAADQWLSQHASGPTGRLALTDTFINTRFCQPGTA